MIFNKNLEILLCGSDLDYEKLLEELHDNLQKETD